MASTTLDPERAALLKQLAGSRAALINTTSGLSDEQAGLRPTVSALCLGGLIKHAASTEEGWLRFAVEGPSAMRYDMPDGVTWADFMAGTAREVPQWALNRQNDFEMLPGDTLAAIIERYERVAAATEQVVATIADLSATQPLPEAPWHQPGSVYSVREVLIHVIAETAQHAGHADILRESIDGHTAT
jgi:uncharacterized damage-inducible protein DinB